MKWLALLIIMISACVMQSACAEEQPTNVDLTILYTNDLHGRLLPFEYSALGKTEADVGGAGRRATLIRKIKSESKNPVLVMDAGDVFIGGPLHNLTGEPDFAVMNAAPYDILTLGNHDFQGDAYTGTSGPSGLEILQERTKQARFPVISANVIVKATGKTLVPPYHIFERGGIKVGVFGLTAMLTADYPQAASLQLVDPVLTAKSVVAELKGKCDFIVALTHIGYPNDLELAATVPDIDVVIGGHSHTWLFEPTLVRRDRAPKDSEWVGGTIVCQDGEWGKALGRLDLSLSRRPDGRFAVVKYAGKLIEIDCSIEPAKDIDDIIRNYSEK